MKITIITKLILLSFIMLVTNSFSQSFLWVKKISYDIKDISTDNQGNVYQAGIFSGTNDFDPGPNVFSLTSIGYNDSVITKFDSSGNFIWAKKIGSIYNASSSSGLRAITVDLIGNVYATGGFKGTMDFDPGINVFNLTSSGDDDIFILKLDTFGNFIWAKKMGGSDNYDLGNSIKVDSNQNVFTTGYFQSQMADFDPGTAVYNLNADGGLESVFISKLNISGDFVWAKKIAGDFFIESSSLTLDLSGNVLTTGFFGGTVDFNPGTSVFDLSSAGTHDIYVSKLNSAGDFVWAKKMGGTEIDHPTSIAVDSFGNVLTTGYFEGRGDFDPGSGVFNLGQSSVFGHREMFISKLDNLGNFVWAKRFGGSNEHIGSSIAIDNIGNVYTTGLFTGGSTDFDPGSGVYLLNSSTTNTFISKLDSTGNFLSAIQFIGDSNRGKSIVLDNTGSIYNTGDFGGTVDFDPNSSIFNLTSTALIGNQYLLKLNPQNLVIENNIKVVNSISIYPNPSTSFIEIDLSHDEIVDFEVEIIDVLGQTVLKTKNQNKIDISNLLNGLYVIKIQKGINLFCQKIIKN